jgi:hypothetical protein
MTDSYQQASEAFFDELARTENSETRKLFLAMLRECVLRSACDAAANPTVGVGQWSGGRISICDEWTKDVESALARAKGKASPDADAGFAYPPI